MPPTDYSADSGAAIADDESAYALMPERFARLALATLRPSPTNPRRHFNATKLNELAESIKASGVHQPILVRPGHPLEDWYEIVSGERRFRASQLAGAADIPAMIRPLSDHQVLEIQLVENLQRDDLSPLEEAEGYQRLVDATGIAKEEIGERIGRSRGYVYGRLKLLDLCQEARQALADGAIDASVGLLIARIPNEGLQRKALTEFSREDWTGDRMSVRRARAWINQHVMIRLAEAPFDLSDAKLVPAAGSCQQCIKRTGAAPDLFSDFPDAPDLCTDRECYQGKVTALYAGSIAKARAKGVEVIEGEAALEIKPAQFGALRGYSPLARAIEDEDRDDDDDDAPHLGSLLTREERKQVKLLVDPHSGRPIEIVPNEVLDAVVARQSKDGGKAAARDRAGRQKEAEAADRAYAATQLAAKHAGMWREAALPELMRAVLDERRVQAFSAAVLRVVLHHVTGSDDIGLDAVGTGLGLSADDPRALDWDQLSDLIAAIPDVDLGPRLLAVLLASEAEKTQRWAGSGGNRELAPSPVMDDVASLAGIDLQRYRDEATEALRDEYEALQPKARAGGTFVDPKLRQDMPAGARVRFKADLRGPGGKMRKVSGREGTVEQWVGDGALSVRYGKGANDHAIADWTELQVLTHTEPATTAPAKPARKGKTSKAEAQAGIAAELQALEGKRAPATPLEALEQGAEAAT